MVSNITLKHQWSLLVASQTSWLSVSHKFRGTQGKSAFSWNQMYFLDSYTSQVGDLILTIEHMFYSLPYLYSSKSSEDIYLSSVRELVNEDISKHRKSIFLPLG